MACVIVRMNMSERDKERFVTVRVIAILLPRNVSSVTTGTKKKRCNILIFSVHIMHMPHPKINCNCNLKTNTKLKPNPNYNPVL